MRALVVGNWKMNGRLAEARALLGALARGAGTAPPRGEAVVCPPATLIAEAAALLRDSPIGVGGQDCHAEDGGAFTGDVAAPMLADLGCGHVILGHSERRRGHGESDRLVAAKAAAARRAGLVSILCLGESAAERQAGEAVRRVGEQLAGALPRRATAADTVVAYEPVWAIGTGVAARPDEVADMHLALRERLVALLGEEGRRLRLLYGGSVTPANAAELLARPHVDGALVGGASLDAEAFWSIVQALPAAPVRGP